MTTNGPTAWRVLRDRAPFGTPGPEDVLATIEATDRTEARRLAESAFPTERVVVALASLWPLEPQPTFALRFVPDTARRITLAPDDRPATSHRPPR
jgi:hypothetical protein